MTPAQKDSLLKTGKRWGFSLSLVVSVAAWGFKQYDATNQSAVEFRAYRDSIEQRHVLDTLKMSFQMRELRGVVFHTDSAVRKICAAVKGGC